MTVDRATASPPADAAAAAAAAPPDADLAFVAHRTVVDGLRCRYFECGQADGPAVVLFPSMLVIGPSYDDTAVALARRGLHVYVVELPGSGRSALPITIGASICAQPM